MNLSVRGSLFLTLSHQWRVSFPIPPQAKVVPTSALTGLLNSLGSLSSVIPHLFFQSFQWQSEARAIVLPHLAPQISNSLCSQERSLLCYFVFGILLLDLGTLPGAGVPCNYFLQCLWEEGGSPDGYSLLVPIFLHSLWRLEHVWRPCGAVLCVLSQFWFGRLLAESLLFLSQEEELVSSRDCVLTFWHPGFQSHGYSLLPYKIAFTLCQKKKKSLETWK